MARKLPNMKRNGQPLAPSTIETYKWATDIITDELGNQRLHTLTVEQVEAMLDRLAENGMSKASLHKIRSKLGQVIDFARIRKHVRENVARGAELPAAAKPTESRNALVPDDARKLLEALGLNATVRSTGSVYWSGCAPGGCWAVLGGPGPRRRSADCERHPRGPSRAGWGHHLRRPQDRSVEADHRDRR
ncbi:MAG: hypothetical protein R2716_00270 [Microthrixaceae bacterium]